MQIYVSVPGSKKIILELPLVIGSRSGIGSRSSSMASQTSSEMSWVDLNLPDAPEGERGTATAGGAPGGRPTPATDAVFGVPWGNAHPFPPCLAAPPCYLDIVPEDHRLESPTTPLLDDPDSFDSPIFMYAPEFKFMPPPTYTEVSSGAPRAGCWAFGEQGGDLGFGEQRDLGWGGQVWFWMVALGRSGGEWRPEASHRPLGFFPRWIPASPTTMCSECRAEVTLPLFFFGL